MKPAGFKPPSSLWKLSCAQHIWQKPEALDEEASTYEASWKRLDRCKCAFEKLNAKTRALRIVVTILLGIMFVYRKTSFAFRKNSLNARIVLTTKKIPLQRDDMPLFQNSITAQPALPAQPPIDEVRDRDGAGAAWNGQLAVWLRQNKMSGEDHRKTGD